MNYGRQAPSASTRIQATSQTISTRSAERVNPGAYGAPTIESTLEPEARIGGLPAPKPIFVRVSASYGHRASTIRTRLMAPRCLPDRTPTGVDAVEPPRSWLGNAPCAYLGDRPAWRSLAVLAAATPTPENARAKQSAPMQCRQGPSLHIRPFPNNRSQELTPNSTLQQRSRPENDGRQHTGQNQADPGDDDRNMESGEKRRHVLNRSTLDACQRQLHRRFPIMELSVCANPPRMKRQCA